MQTTYVLGDLFANNICVRWLIYKQHMC